MKRHPLISRMELMAAFGLSGPETDHLMAPYISAGRCRNINGFYEMVQ